MFWEIVSHLAAAVVTHGGLASLLCGLPILFGLMDPYSRQEKPPAKNNNDFWANFGNGDPAGMTGATSTGIGFTNLLQSAGFNPDGSPRLSINSSSPGGFRQTIFSFNNGPGHAFSGGGGGYSGGGGGGGGSGASGSNYLKPNYLEPMSTGARNFGTAGYGGAGAEGSLTMSQAGGAAGGMGGASGWVRAGTGLAGAVASYMDQQARNNQSAGSGAYSGTTSNDPWGPSTDYRLQAMKMAQQLLNGGGGGGGGRGGGGGGASYKTSFAGSQELANAMRQAAMGGDPNMAANANYMQNALNDPYGGSQLLGRTFEAADGLNNANVDQFVANMMGQYGGGSGGGGGGGGGGGYSGGGGGGGGYSGGSSHPLVGVGADIRNMIDSDYTANPELQAMIDQVNRGTTDSYQQGVAGLSGQAEGAGMYGSSDHQVADAAAATGFTRGLAENETGIRYQDFGRWRDEVMQAMGLGTQYDLGMAATDAQARASANATNASSRSAANSLALQGELGNRGLMLDAMGLQNQMSLGGLGVMQNLSGLDVQNRQSMLGMGLDYSNANMDQLGAAFGANMGVEQAANSAAAQRAAMQNQQARFNAQQPWNNLAKYMDIINGASSGYGTSTESGNRAVAQQQQGSPWLAALQGGLGAAQAANNIYRGWNQGNG